MNYLYIFVLAISSMNLGSISPILKVVNFANEVVLNDVIAAENTLGCTVKPAAFQVTIGEEYYPNAKAYDLQNPLTVECIDGDLEKVAEYFFTPDSIIRVVLTTWNMPVKLGMPTPEAKQEALIRNKLIFQDKLTELQNILITQLGQPYVAGKAVQLEGNSNRIDYKWKGSFHAELSVVFSDKLGYGRLRLLVFKD